METNRKQNSREYLGIPIIIPAYEPDKRLLTLIGELREKEMGSIIVVNDGSGVRYDSLFQTAETVYGCTVLGHYVNLGKGRALKTAFNYVLLTIPGVVGCVTADADGQHSPACIQKCMKALQENEKALVLGCRDFKRENVPPRSKFGNQATCIAFRFLAGLHISDTQTGLRAIPASYMAELLNVNGERFEFETNMLLEAGRNEVPVVEELIETIYIEENKSSHFRVIKDSVRIYLIFARFLFSSLSSSIVDLALFTLLCGLLKDQELGPISYITGATILARLVSAAYNYYINYKVVFKSKRTFRQTGIRYFLLAVIQMGCSAVLVNLLFPLFGGYEVFIKIPVDVLLFFLSFVIQREFVYQ